MLRVLLLLAACAAPLRAFPDGAPAEACLRGMVPNHGGAKSQSHRSSPFIVQRQTSRGRITVTIQGINGDAYIKGFMIQARDPATGKAARGQGAWVDTQNVKDLRECAAVTHSDRGQKTGVSVTWEGREDVAIYATVLQSYSRFWADVEAVEQGLGGGPLGSGPSGFGGSPSGFSGPAAHNGGSPTGFSGPSFGVGGGPSGFSGPSAALGRGPSGFSGPSAARGGGPSGFGGPSNGRGGLGRHPGTLGGPAGAFSNNFGNRFGKKK